MKAITKLFASLGNKKAMQKLSSDEDIAAKIQPVDGDKIAQSQEGQIFIAFNEIQDYLFMESLVICTRNIKNFKGARIIFKSTNGDFELRSDAQEIGCEFSNELNRFVSEITFDITPELIKRVDKRDFQSVEFHCKKKTMVMEMVVK